MGQKSNFIVRGGLDMSSFTKGLEQTQKQITTFQNTISKSMGVVKAAIGSIAIGSLVKDSLKAAMSVESSMNQLSRIMGNNTREFNSWAQNQSKGFGIAREDAYKYGATYGNLLSGFLNGSDEVQSKTVQLLKASAVTASATGRSMEDTMERIRSGLLGNTESIEDLGINVNVAMLQSTKAFKEFANGRSWQQLSFQEQQQIRLMAILEQANTKYGDSLAGTTATRQMNFLATLKNIRLNMGQAFLPIYNAVLPALNALSSKIEAITSTFSQFTQALFGKAIVNTTQNAEKQTTAISDMGDAAEAAGKKAKKSLAGFDELNVISSGSTSGSGSKTTTTNSSTGTGEAGKKSGSLAIDPKIIKSVENFKKAIQPTVDALKDLWDASKPLAKSLCKGFVDFVKQLVSIGKDALVEWIPDGIEGIANALKKVDPESAEKIGTGLGKIGVALAGFKIVSGLVEFIKGIGTSLLGLSSGVSSLISLNPMAFVAIFNDFFEGLDEALWDMSPQWAKDIWTTLWDTIERILKNTFNFDQTKGLVKDVVDSFKRAFSGKEDWKEIGKDIVLGILEGLTIPISAIFEPVYDFFDSLISAICDVFGIHSPAKEMKPYGGYIMEGLIGGFSDKIKSWKTTISTFGAEAISQLKTWSSNGVNAIKSQFSIANIKSHFDSIVTTMKNSFTGIPDWFKTKFTEAWTNVKNVFSTGGKIFDGIKTGIDDTFRAIVNKLITGINTVIKTPFDKINSMLNAIRDVGVMGLKPFKGLWGSNPISVPKIPALANGGYVKASSPQLALIGDNTREGEIVSPESKFQEMLNKASGASSNSEQVQLLREQNSLLRSILAKPNITSKNIFDAVKSEDEAHKSITGRSSFGY